MNGGGGLLIPHYRSDATAWLGNGVRGPLAKHSHVLSDLRRWLNRATEISRQKQRYGAMVPSSQENRRMPWPLVGETKLLLTCYECKPSDTPGVYHAHMDSSPGDKSSRLGITTLFYLSPDGVEGGELRVGLLAEGAGAKIVSSIDISPRPNRLVLFLSQYIPHEVMETRSRRFAMASFLRLAQEGE